MPTLMSKGSNVETSSARMVVEIRWTATPGAPDVDASALLLGSNGQVGSDADFIFYNQSAHSSGAVVHAGKSAPGLDSLRIDTSRLPDSVERVVIAASADGGPFGALDGLFLVVGDEHGNALLRFEITDATSETAFVFGEIYRRAGRWKFRAIGQGYATGLAGLATDFGINVDDEPAPQPTVAPSVTPAATPAPPRNGGAEQLPVDIRKRLDLRKKQVAVSLAKHAHGNALRARVVLVLDASGSMAGLYAKGIVADIVERMAAVADHLDDDGTMQAFTFASKPARLPDLRIPELPEWIRLHVRVGKMKGFGRPTPNLAPGQVDMKSVGIGNEEQKVIAEVRAMVRAEPQAVPTLVLFFSDGGVYRNSEIEHELRAAAVEPVFWQFVGLGRANFGVLERFDTLPGRIVDNVGFFAVDHFDKVPDSELYDRLLSEFPSWVTAARAQGILR